MLASITPLGERGRRATWGVTVSAFMAGATVAGAVAGALAGAAGALALGSGGDERVRLVALAIAVLIALSVDLLPGAVPGPRRQVNELWLDRYRGWVYGLGYGTQLGLGLTTVISSAATYVALFAAFLSGGPRGGALIYGCFGAARGVAPLLVAHVRRPDQLLSVHRRLARWRRPAENLAVVALAGILIATAAWSAA